MPRKTAVEIILNEHERKILTQLQKGTHSPLHFKRRAAIILLANDGETNNSIERKLNMDGETVTKWRNKYASVHEEMEKIEKETPNKLRDFIEKTLSDAPRPGTPSTFLDEQIASIIALSCESPEKLGLPFSHWTPTLLRQEVISRGIVTSISVTQIGRFLKR